MTRHGKRSWLLAAGLSAVAGYVDAIGFLRLGGLFVSFMSGNSTKLGVGLGGGDQPALAAGGLIACFVAGAAIGSLLAAWAGRRRKPAVLALVTLLLSVAAALDGSLMAIGAMTLAMGAVNAVFQRNGEVSIGVTYMTGTLVKLGQRLAALLLGRDRWGWVPYLMLWAGLMAGAVAGAALYPRLGMAALWIAAGATALLTVAAAALGPAPD